MQVMHDGSFFDALRMHYLVCPIFLERECKNESTRERTSPVQKHSRTHLSRTKALANALVPYKSTRERTCPVQKHSRTHLSRTKALANALVPYKSTRERTCPVQKHSRTHLSRTNALVPYKCTCPVQKTLERTQKKLNPVPGSYRIKYPCRQITMPASICSDDIKAVCRIFGFPVSKGKDALVVLGIKNVTGKNLLRLADLVDVPVVDPSKLPVEIRKRIKACESDQALCDRLRARFETQQPAPAPAAEDAPAPQPPAETAPAPAEDAPAPQPPAEAALEPPPDDAALEQAFLRMRIRVDEVLSETASAVPAGPWKAGIEDILTRVRNMQ